MTIVPDLAAKATLTDTGETVEQPSSCPDKNREVKAGQASSTAGQP